MKKNFFLAAMLFMLFSGFSSFSQSSYTGEIRMIGFNFAPVGWALCNGQLLPISTNTALFSILGTTYGGDGKTNFALPDLRGRAPMNFGMGNGLSPVDLGQVSGAAAVTLTTQNLPSHNHLINATTTDGTSGNPSGNIPANTKLLDKEYSNTTPNTLMKGTMLQSTGQNIPVNNMQPYIGIYYIICLQGYFPPRN